MSSITPSSSSEASAALERIAALSGAALKYCHPEINAAVSARSRARALYSEGYGQGPTGALSRPRDDLYSIYANELQFVRDLEFADSGRVGALRLKGLLLGPVARPKSAAEYAEMREAAEAHLARIGGGVMLGSMNHA